MAVTRLWAGVGTTLGLAGYLSADEADVRVAAVPTAGGSEVQSDSFAVTNAATERWFTAALPTLEPETEYDLYVKIGGVRDTAKTLTMTTPPRAGAPRSFTCCIGSCFNDVTSDAFTNIAARTPDFVLTMGDNGYPDVTTNNQAAFRANYKTNIDAEILGQSEWWAWQWDDHDYSDNDSDASSAAKPAAVATARQCIPNAPAFAEASATYYYFVWGRVRFLMLDVRSERAGSSTLGATQLAWVLAQITATRDAGQALCINMSTSVLETGADAWGNATWSGERDTILQAVVDAGMATSTFIINGDTHSMAADDGTAVAGLVAGATIPVCQAAPLGQTASAGSASYSQGAQYVGSDEQYGLLTITDNGSSSITVVFSGRDIGDVERVSLTMTLSGMHLERGRPKFSQIGPGLAAAFNARVFDPTNVGSGAATYPSPLLRVVTIPTSTSNVDITGVGTVEAALIFYTTASSATAQNESCWGWGAYTQRSSDQCYTAWSGESGDNTPSRLSGITRAIGIQTQGVSNATYTESPDIYAVASAISGGLRLAFTVSGTPTGENQGGRAIVVIFPEGTNTDAQIVNGLANTSPLDTMLFSTGSGAFIFGHNAADDDGAFFMPGHWGAADGTNEWAVAFKAEGDQYGSRSQTGDFALQTNIDGTEAWATTGLALGTSAFTVGAQADRLLGLVVAGYSFAVGANNKVSSGVGSTQNLTAAGFTPTVLMITSNCADDATGYADKIRLSVGFTDGTNTYSGQIILGEDTTDYLGTKYQTDRIVAIDDYSAGYSAGPHAAVSSFAAASQLTWTSNDTSTPELYWIAFGAGTAA